MARADAVDAPVALDQAHRVPRQVVVDDVAGLLQVDALGQDVGGDERGRRGRPCPDGGVRRARREAPQRHCPCPPPDPVPCRADRGRRPAAGRILTGRAQSAADPVDRVGEVAEMRTLRLSRSSAADASAAASAAISASCVDERGELGSCSGATSPPRPRTVEQARSCARRRAGRPRRTAPAGSRAPRDLGGSPVDSSVSVRDHSAARRR